MRKGIVFTARGRGGHNLQKGSGTLFGALRRGHSVENVWCKGGFTVLHGWHYCTYSIQNMGAKMFRDGACGKAKFPFVSRTGFDK
jgi:hypothetical protein